MRTIYTKDAKGQKVDVSATGKVATAYFKRKKVSTTIKCKDGNQKTISIYVDDATEKMLSQIDDESVIRSYIISEYRLQNKEKWAKRRLISLDKITEQGNDFMSDEIAPDEAAVKQAMINSVKQALHLLTSEQQRIISLYFFEEKKQTETAKILGVSQSAVAQQIRTVLSRLKKILEKNKEFL